MKWIDSIPMPTLIMITVIMGLAPFTPEPHLFEKLRMLSEGSLSKPIDIFDLVMHISPLVILILKLSRGAKKVGEAH